MFKSMLKRVLTGKADSPEELAWREIMRRDPAHVAEEYLAASNDDDDLIAAVATVVVPPPEPPVNAQVEMFSGSSDGLKWCSYHKKYEPLANFYANKKSKDGYTWACKDYYNRPRKRGISAEPAQLPVKTIKVKKSRAVITPLMQRDLEAPAGMLWCSKCGRYQPIEDFSRDNSKPYRADGRRNYCKQWGQLVQAVWREKTRNARDNGGA
jgi:hypothetical protein